MNWIIENHNDVGPNDDGFWEWWTVSNGTRSFKCDSEGDAKWLAELLNAAKIEGQESPASAAKDLGTAFEKLGNTIRRAKAP